LVGQSFLQRSPRPHGRGWLKISILSARSDKAKNPSPRWKLNQGIDHTANQSLLYVLDKVRKQINFNVTFQSVTAIHEQFFRDLFLVLTL
jgi:hypothetical protein